LGLCENLDDVMNVEIFDNSSHIISCESILNDKLIIAKKQDFGKNPENKCIIAS
jgi:hypothetical protein